MPHTPGPWTVWNPDGVFVQSHDRDICVMTPTSQDLVDHDDEDLDNAYLLAAAPEMLEALQWFINDLDGTHTAMVDFDTNVQRARNAIAKATTRS